VRFFHAPTCPILGQKAKNLHFFEKKMKVIVNLRSPVSFFICIFAAKFNILHAETTYQPIKIYQLV